MPLISDSIGRVLGKRYRLVSALGAGASAHVFLAEDVTLQRRVAVKVLQPALANDEAFLQAVPGRGPVGGRAEPPPRPAGLRLGRGRPTGPTWSSSTWRGEPARRLRPRVSGSSHAQAARIGVRGRPGPGLRPRPGPRPPRRQAGQPPLRRGGSGAGRRLRRGPGPGRGGVDRAGRGHGRHGPVRLARAGRRACRSTAGPTSTRWRWSSTRRSPARCRSWPTPRSATLMARVGAALPRHPALGPLDDTWPGPPPPTPTPGSTPPALAARLQAVAASLPPPAPLPLRLDSGGSRAAPTPSWPPPATGRHGDRAQLLPARRRRRALAATETTVAAGVFDAEAHQQPAAGPRDAGPSPGARPAPGRPPRPSPAAVVGVGPGWWRWASWRWPWRCGGAPGRPGPGLHPDAPGAGGHRPDGGRRPAGGRADTSCWRPSPPSTRPGCRPAHRPASPLGPQLAQGGEHGDRGALQGPAPGDRALPGRAHLFGGEPEAGCRPPQGLVPPAAGLLVERPDRPGHQLVLRQHAGRHRRPLRGDNLGGHSKGPQPVPVPSVASDTSYAQAQATLQAAGLQATEAQGNNPTVPAGQVISTSPPAGTRWRRARR